MAFNIRWLGTACFEIRLSNGKTIVIDPYLDDSASSPFGSEKVEGADFIFLTHGHYDHVLDVGKLVGRFHSEVYCSSEVSRSLIQWQQVESSRLHSVSVGDRVEETGFEAEAVRGVHVDFAAEYRRLTGGDMLKDFEGDFQSAIQNALEATMGAVSLPEQFSHWMTMYPGGEQLNYVFDFEGTDRVYMAGSYPDPSLIRVAQNTRATIMLLQVMGGKALQGLEESTLQFALASGAKIVIPQHHDPLFKGAASTDLTKLRGLFSARGIEFLELIPGQWHLMSSTR